MAGENGKWFCDKCHTWNSPQGVRCAWCSKPRPKPTPPPPKKD